MASDIAEVFFQIFLEVVLILGWEIIQSGSPWSLPIIAVLGFAAALLFRRAIKPILLPRVIHLPVDGLPMMLVESITRSEQVYRVAGSRMANLGYDNKASKRGTYFGLLTVGDHYLVVSSPRPIDEKRLTYNGCLTFSLNDEIEHHLSNSASEQRESLLPMTLSVSQRRFTGDLIAWIAIEAALIALIIYALERFISVNLL